MKANSLMKRGSGIFKCECCGRQTRDTGAQAVGSRLCPQCWELSGYYNEYQDGVSEDWGDDVKASIRNWCAEIVAKGGELDGDFKELLEIVGN